MPLRVLHLGKYFPPFAGGIEHFHADLCAAHEKEGVLTLSVVHHHQKGVPSRNEFISWNGVKCPILRVRTHGSVLYAPISPAFPGHLYACIRDFSPDVIHVHMPNLSAFWLLASPAARRTPWLVHWHADVVSSTIDRRLATAYRIYRPFEHRLLAKARVIVATSPAYLATSEPLRPWRKKCRVIPLGVAPERYAAADDAALAQARALWGDGGKRVLSVGRLSYYKGHGYLIEAAEMIAEARFVIVGAGEQWAHLNAEISRRGLQEKVILAGKQPDETLRALLQTCDCFCLPSIERTEAFGVALLEAMRYGRPCVITDVGGSGMSWVVRDGATGIAVEAANSHALGEALTRLLSDGELRTRLGAQARSDFAARFEIERPARTIRELYEAIAGAKKEVVDES